MKSPCVEIRIFVEDFQNLDVSRPKGARTWNDGRVELEFRT
jgi:hypothetical protein